MEKDLSYNLTIHKSINDKNILLLILKNREKDYLNPHINNSCKLKVKEFIFFKDYLRILVFGHFLNNNVLFSEILKTLRKNKNKETKMKGIPCNFETKC